MPPPPKFRVNAINVVYILQDLADLGGIFGNQARNFFQIATRALSANFAIGRDYIINRSLTVYLYILHYNLHMICTLSCSKLNWICTEWKTWIFTV